MSDAIPLYGRLYDLQISTNSVNINLSSLHFKFNTTAWINGTPKTLRLRLWNAYDQTLEPIKQEGGQIVLSAGYNKAQGIVFSGQIIQIRTGRDEGVNTFCDFIATDNDAFYTQGFISESLAAGSSVNNRLFRIAEASGMTLNDSDIIVDTSTATNTKLPRGRVFYGLAKDHLRQVAKAAGANYEVEGNNITVLGNYNYKNLPVPDINHKTGMIGVPTQMIDGIHVQTLMSPFIVQGQLIHINSASIQAQELSIQPGGNVNQGQAVTVPRINTDGYYKVLYVNHEGDTRGPDWYTNIVCYDKQITNASQPGYLGASMVG